MIKAHAQAATTETEFAARIGRICARVALRLSDNIQQTDTSLSQMTGERSEAVDAVATAYRWLHDISGIGPTVGFEATGRLARSCAAALLGAFRARRGLSPDELALLTESFESLRITALNEIHLTESVRG